MGYDMSIRGKIPASPQHDIDQAQDAYDAASAALQARRASGEFNGNLDAHLEAMHPVDDLWSKLYRLKHPEDFRLNNYGMAKYCDAMLNLGMMHHSNTPKIDWHAMPIDYDTEEEEAAFYEISDRLTGQHGDNPAPTIPSHKFSTNDGWHVTEPEIRAALDAWDSRAERETTHDTDDVTATDYWAEFIAWLRLAADNGGFRVY